MASILKVDTIQAPNGTTAATIDGSGRILQPAKPAFSARLDTLKASQDITSITDCFLDTMEFNIGGHAALTATSCVFTAPVAGIYNFQLHVVFEDVEASNWVQTTIVASNGTTDQDHQYRTLTDVSGAEYFAVTSSALLQLAANETVTPKIRVNNDTAITVRDSSYFNGYLVS